MNHRQWKKNYKKQHGFNPDGFIDKKRREKIIRQEWKFLQSIDFSELAVEIGACVRKALDVILDGLGDFEERTRDILECQKKNQSTPSE